MDVPSFRAGPRSAALACALALWACSGGDPGPSAGEPVVLFEGARLIVGDGSEPVDDAAFLVEGSRFGPVGRAGEIDVPSGAVRVDLGGKTVMPALVDLHSHPGYEDVVRDTHLKENYTPDNLRDHLDRFAYTGHALTLSLGSDPPDDFVWRIREESNRASFTGTRFETVGRGLAWPGTGPLTPARNDTPYPVVSRWQARLAVRELAARGVPFAKIWVEDRGGYAVPGDRPIRDALAARHGVHDVGEPARLTPEIVRAAVDEARRLGLRTIAHVKTVEELKFLLRAGIDAWTHPIADRLADEELLALIQERPELRYIPVITPVFRGGSAPRAAGERPEWLDDPLLRAIQCPAFLEGLGRSFEESAAAYDPAADPGIENIRRFREAGVPVVLGSHDAGGRRVLGWNSHLELEAFVNWVGMTPHEAIVAGTSAAAEFLGRADLGSVTAGKAADFVVLDADPLDDIRNTRRISRVYLRGLEVDRDAMAARWRSRCEAAAGGG